jgi:lysophospholipase L1-like esterase
VAIGDTPSVRKEGAIRIMLLGDSITHGSHSSTGNGYRAPLWNALTNLGYHVDFVGTQTDSYGRFDPTLGDPDHEGISGITIAGTLKRIDGVFDKCGEVDCVLMLLGTNESLLGERMFRNEATNSLVKLLDRIYSRSPSAEVVVATLMPRWTEPKIGDVAANWKYAAITNVFNPTVPGIVAGQCAKGQHAHVLDMHAALRFDQLDDEVHPNDSGYASMAKFWLGAVTNIFPRPASTLRGELLSDRKQGASFAIKQGE